MCGPRLDLEVRLGRAGNEVELVATRIDLVGHDMPVGTPPFHAIIDFSAEQFASVDRPVGHLSRKTRRAAAKKDFEHGGMDAVGPDDGVGLRRSAIRECQPHA
jgi:hypothetical protein